MSTDDEQVRQSQSPRAYEGDNDGNNSDNSNTINNNDDNNNNNNINYYNYDDDDDSDEFDDDSLCKGNANRGKVLFFSSELPSIEHCKSDNVMMKVNEKVVVKKVPLRTHCEGNELPPEVQIALSMKHPFIVKTLDILRRSDSYEMKMELCESGNMRTYLNQCKNREFKMEDKLGMLSMIAIGLNYLHENNICHRDIKPENVFIRKNGVPCIGDFGSSTILKDDETVREYIGTPMYMAPEIVKSKPYDKKCDSWSFGCLAYEMLAQKHPFKCMNRRSMTERIKEGRYTHLELPELPELADAVTDLLRVDKDERLSIKEFIQCDCIQDTIRTLVRNEMWSSAEKSAFLSVSRKIGSS